MAAAIKVAQQSHPTIVVKRQTANSWYKKMQSEAVVQANGNGDEVEEPLALASFDRHTASPVSNAKYMLTSEADWEFLQSIIMACDE